MCRSCRGRSTSKHVDYREDYVERATCDKVVDLFAADFEAFGYETTFYRQSVRQVD